MVPWKMSAVDSFDEGESDFDSVVKDDGVRDVDDASAGAPDEGAPAVVVVEEVVVVEALERHASARRPRSPRSAPPNRSRPPSRRLQRLKPPSPCRKGAGQESRREESRGSGRQSRQAGGQESRQRRKAARKRGQEGGAGQESAVKKAARRRAGKKAVKKAVKKAIKKAVKREAAKKVVKGEGREEGPCQEGGGKKEEAVIAGTGASRSPLGLARDAVAAPVRAWRASIHGAIDVSEPLAPSRSPSGSRPWLPPLALRLGARFVHHRAAFAEQLQQRLGLLLRRAHAFPGKAHSASLCRMLWKTR